jgi:hypothetical protein
VGDSANDDAAQDQNILQRLIDLPIISGFPFPLAAKRTLPVLG